MPSEVDGKQAVPVAASAAGERLTARALSPTRDDEEARPLAGVRRAQRPTNFRAARVMRPSTDPGRPALPM